MHTVDAGVILRALGAPTASSLICKFRLRLSSFPDFQDGSLDHFQILQMRCVSINTDQFCILLTLCPYDLLQSQ